MVFRFMVIGVAYPFTLHYASTFSTLPIEIPERVPQERVHQERVPQERVPQERVPQERAAFLRFS